MPETTVRYLSQMINSERWYSQELARLKAEGHQIIGDEVIINTQRGSYEAVSRSLEPRSAPRSIQE